MTDEREALREIRDLARGRNTAAIVEAHDLLDLIFTKSDAVLAVLPSRETDARTTAMLDAINQIEHATIEYAASSKVADARRIDTAIAHARAVLALFPSDSREAVEAKARAEGYEDGFHDGRRAEADHA